MKPLLALLLLCAAAHAAPRRAAPRSAQQQTRGGQPSAADAKDEGAEEAPAAQPAEDPGEAAAAEPATTTTSVDAGAPSVPGGPSSKAAAPAPKAPGPKASGKAGSPNTLGGSMGTGGPSEQKEKIQTRCGDRLSQLPKKLPNGDAIDLKKSAVAKGVRIDDWKITSKLTEVKFGRDEVCTPHSMSGKWPTAPFFGDASSPVEGNIWMFAYLDGRWVGGAGHWLRPGQTCKGGNLWEVGPDVYYDSDPLKHWTPCPGEYVGFAVSAPARAGQWTVAERSNVILVRWPTPAN